MSQRFLLDACVISEGVRKRPNKRVLEKLQRFESSSVTSSTVWNELWFGADLLADSERKELIHAYLTSLERALPVLAYDKAAARWHARERARLQVAGSPRPFADGQIAAVAVANDLVLVTDNVADFAHFSELRVENWHR